LKLKNMYILGIESSCDETGVAVVEQRGQDAPKLLAHALHSQIVLHQPYGGVVPELASRDHIERIFPLVANVLGQINLAPKELGLVAYTKGPGLAGALLVGAGFAASVAAALGIPLMGIHHLEGHLLSPFLSEDAPKFPFLCLLVSGGHTQLMSVKSMAHYELLGESIDDAAGEAFDKSAKLLGIDYPGGAELSKLAKSGNAQAFQFPRPLLHSKDLNFSFAGLKTSVLTQVKKLEKNLDPYKADLAASVQAAIVEVLVKKTQSALKATGHNRIVVAGGVGANQSLRSSLMNMANQMGVHVHFPPLEWCTDNGAMIAMAAAMRVQHGIELGEQSYAFGVNARWSLSAVSA
jgi:N6-L-threonylcarbamoyladenine synthase